MASRFAYCPYCGAKLAANDVVCPNCGKKLPKQEQHKPSYNQLFGNTYKEGMKRYHQERGDLKQPKRSSFWQRLFHKKPWSEAVVWVLRLSWAAFRLIDVAINNWFQNLSRQCCHSKIGMTALPAFFRFKPGSSVSKLQAKILWKL